MRQLLIAKNEQIKELSGSRIKFYHKNLEGRELRIDGQTVTKVTIPFSAKILSGGTLDLDFKVSEELAQAAVTLLGAYWDGKVVTAYFKALNDTVAVVPNDTALLNAVLVQVTTFRQIEEGILGGVMSVDQSGKAISLEKTEKSKRPRRSRS